MIIFIDDDFKCHTQNDGTMREISSEFFDGRCKQFIEGYRFVPSGETWIREDGIEFTGQMISPWKDYSVLEACQRAYEEALDLNQNAIDALAILGITE